MSAKDHYSSERQRKAAKVRWTKEDHSPETRYERKIVRKESGCWEAIKPGATGYGSMAIDGAQVALHRASWMMHCGPIPEGLCVLHVCDNRACSNPQHLYLGTKKENRKDFMERHPRSEQLMQAAAKNGAKGVRRFWQSMTKEERRIFCQRRTKIQREKNGNIHPRWGTPLKEKS